MSFRLITRSKAALPVTEEGATIPFPLGVCVYLWDVRKQPIEKRAVMRPMRVLLVNFLSLTSIKVHYRVHNNLPLVPFLSLMIQSTSSHSALFIIHFGVHLAPTQVSYIKVSRIKLCIRFSFIFHFLVHASVNL